MEFKKNKNGYLEIEYEGVNYFLDGKEWIIDIKINSTYSSSTWYSNTNHKTIKKFIIPTNGLSRKEAEKQIKQLMAEYKQPIKWGVNHKIQTTLTKLLRQEKLKELENVKIL